MTPQNFPQANRVFAAPPGEEDRVYPLYANSDGEVVTELWRPSWRERLSILIFGRVWLRLLGSRPQPAAVEGKRRMFL